MNLPSFTRLTVLRPCIWLAPACAFLGLNLSAVVPEHSVTNGAVCLKGVGPDNPLIYDNDWWVGVIDNNYLRAQASLDSVNLRGNIVSRDMWDKDSVFRALDRDRRAAGAIHAERKLWEELDRLRIRILERHLRP